MRYLTVTSPDINNGTGFRVTLWVAGCRRHCRGCHNKHTWDYNQGFSWEKVRDRIFEELDKPYIRGLTLSGGDPLDQDDSSLEELTYILKYIKTKYPTKDIWLYTGYTYEELSGKQRQVLEYVDVLVDGPYVQELRDKCSAYIPPFVGSSNQRVIHLK